MDYHCHHESPECECRKLEIVTTCVGFDDLLDHTLSLNHPHCDTYIVVTTHRDKKTQACAKKHGAICVQTDNFQKNGRHFNKGAAINSGMNRFQYNGWRLHLDSDIMLPDNFRRILFNHTHLEKDCVYGADRIDVIARCELDKTMERHHRMPQHSHSCLIDPGSPRPIGARYVCPLEGYAPIGFFQLWHASAHKAYPYSLGTAAHDDTMFATQWSKEHRRHLPTIVCYHLCGANPKWGENWDGKRKQPKF